LRVFVQANATAYVLQRSNGAFLKQLTVNEHDLPTGDYGQQNASTDLEQEFLRPSTLISDGRCVRISA
jgi:hypothetical protein